MRKHDPDLCLKVAEVLDIPCQTYNGICYRAEAWDSSHGLWKLSYDSSKWKSFMPDVDAADAWEVLDKVHPKCVPVLQDFRLNLKLTLCYAVAGMKT